MIDLDAERFRYMRQGTQPSRSQIAHLIAARLLKLTLLLVALRLAFAFIAGIAS